jgi:hypothetical protein
MNNLRRAHVTDEHQNYTNFPRLRKRAYGRNWPIAEITAGRGGGFLGHFRRRGDAAPDDGCDSLTQANNWRPVSKQVIP